MASVATIKVDIKVSGVKAAQDLLKQRPAQVRRVLRGSMGKATRASAKRVKSNVAPNKRTRQLQKAEGQKVVTYKESVVGLVGARSGFRIQHNVYGPVNPSRYDRIIEKGRVASFAVAGGWLVLRFPSIAKLREFLGKGISKPKRPYTGGRRSAEPYPGWSSIARRFGAGVADRVRRNKFGDGFVLFLKKVGPAPGFAPVSRDEDQLGTEAEAIIASDMARAFSRGRR